MELLTLSKYEASLPSQFFYWTIFLMHKKSEIPANVFSEANITSFYINLIHNMGLKRTYHYL